MLLFYLLCYFYQIKTIEALIDSITAINHVKVAGKVMDKKKTILLIDTDVEAIKPLHDHLIHLGHATIFSNKALEAISFLKETRVDLIFIDYAFQATMLFELVSTIYEISNNPDDKIPIICTIDDAYKNDDINHGIGIEARLIKPIVVSQLKSLLKRFLPEYEAFSIGTERPVLVNHPSLNLVRLEEMHGRNYASIEKVIDSYVCTTHEMLEHLKKAIINRDFKEVKVIGHEIRGTSASIGFDFMKEIGALIKTTGYDMDVSRTEELYLTSMQGLKDIVDFKIKLKELPL